MKLGVIGVGNMGAAIIKGYIAGGADAETICAAGHSSEKTAAFAKETGVTVCDTISELTELCGAVMIAVKPKDVKSVLAEMAPSLTPEKVIISIAAGLTIRDLEQMIEENSSGLSQGEGSVKNAENEVKIVRVMPNTPSMVGEGMSALCRSVSVEESEFRFVMDVFRSIGRAEEIPENLMDAVTGVSGSGPAFVYLFIEALADGAVLAGLPRQKAISFAAQTVLGSAKMVLETGQHPGELKDAVCSPGGTTIEGVRSLEASGFRHAAMSAVIAAAEKSKKM